MDVPFRMIPCNPSFSIQISAFTRPGSSAGLSERIVVISHGFVVRTAICVSSPMV